MIGQAQRSLPFDLRRLLFEQYQTKPERGDGGGPGAVSMRGSRSLALVARRGYPARGRHLQYPLQRTSD